MDRLSKASAPEKPQGAPSRELMDLYYHLNLARLLEERLVLLHARGVLSAAPAVSRGHEAVAVGTALAMGAHDVMAPGSRHLGALLARGMEVRDVVAAHGAQGRKPTLGREVGVALGSLELGLLGGGGHDAARLSVLVGMGVVFKQHRQPDVAWAMVGEGADACGPFHEAMNLAALRRLPLVCVVEEDARRKNGAPRARAYGCRMLEAHGQHVLEVLDAARQAARYCRDGKGPVLLSLDMEPSDPVALFDAACDGLVAAPTRKQREDLHARLVGLVDDAVQPLLPPPAPVVGPRPQPINLV